MLVWEDHLTWVTAGHRLTPCTALETPQAVTPGPFTEDPGHHGVSPQDLTMGLLGVSTARQRGETL